MTIFDILRPVAKENQENNKKSHFWPFLPFFLANFQFLTFFDTFRKTYHNYGPKCCKNVKINESIKLLLKTPKTLKKGQKTTMSLFFRPKRVKKEDFPTIKKAKILHVILYS